MICVYKPYSAKIAFGVRFKRDGMILIDFILKNLMSIRGECCYSVNRSVNRIALLNFSTKVPEIFWNKSLYQKYFGMKI